MKNKKAVEIDPNDGLKIFEDMFGDDEGFKVEDFDDFMWKYLRPIRTIYKRWIPDFRFWARETFQRITRKNHVSDCDAWDCGHTMAPYILKHLKAFLKYSKEHGHGYPMYFSNFEPNDDDPNRCSGLNMTKDEYDKAMEEGRYGGGEMDAWHATITEMIFAFEYSMFSGSCDKDEDNFYKRWNILDPHRETEDNLSWGYNYKTNDDMWMTCSQESHDEIQADTSGKYDGYKLLGKHRSYYNHEEAMVLGKRAEEGMRLFGKFYWNLWD